MQNRLLGQLYGLVMYKGAITQHSVIFSTTEPVEASKYVELVKTLLDVKDSNIVYYLEDVKYGKDEQAIELFEQHLPDIRQKRLRIFHRPYKNKPMITIVQYDENMSKVLSYFFKHLQILQKNKEFSKGFLDASLSHAKFDDKQYALRIFHDKSVPYLLNSLEVLRLCYEQKTTK